MNENKRTLSGNDGFIPVEQNESLFWKAWDKSGNGGGQSERQKEYSESRVREASLSSVVVLQALDVIFAEVSPSLDFDEDQVSSPVFSMRWAAPIGTSIVLPAVRRISAPSSVTRRDNERYGSKHFRSPVR